MAFCRKCGAEIGDEVKFCTKCGAEQNAHTAPAAQTGSIKVSDWDGGVLDTIVNSLIASLMISFTCGIATPWAICYIIKFVAEHANIDGKRITFDGTGGSLFANWVKWLLLTVITCGIYSFWVTPRLYKWVVSHIHLVD